VSTALATDGRDLRAVLHRLAEAASVHGALLVAPDGLVIASSLRGVVAVEAISALAATLGRELELASAPSRGALGVAQFASDGGMLILGAPAIGFVVVLAGDAADPARLAADVRDAVGTIERAWRAPLDS
jgi:predicted regulator of Ras-like GTPase activity (Roadblock/LC7/MglB family)